MEEPVSIMHPTMVLLKKRFESLKLWWASRGICSLSCIRLPRGKASFNAFYHSKASPRLGFSLVSHLDLLMDAKPIIVKLDALRAYHSIDRALYAILVNELWRDPVESLHIIALCLWLEQVGFGKVTRKILACPPLFINQTAEEATLCLKCIKDSLFICSTEATDTKNLAILVNGQTRKGIGLSCLLGSLYAKQNIQFINLA
ncbi:uncharacterized protein Fot_03780 [Forsythia ovata]|uniref:Reverse transcriptase domain-containing protein n=1 Tax=Forsythia ovata TaxID=205694 RepID=A0ABD1XBA5_9LAMI